MTDEYRWKATDKDQALPKPPPPILPEWQAAGLWVVANAIGLVAGFFLYLLTAELVTGAIAIGIFIGWMEMLILALQRARVGWLWIFNTTVAFLTWGAALPVLGGINALSGLGLGVLLGLLQWLNLRKRVEAAIWWLPVNALAWSIGLGLYAPLTDAVGTWLAGIGAAGLIAGAMLAGVLTWLLRRPVFELPDETPLKDDYQS
jgi:hypothetical protein